MKIFQKLGMATTGILLLGGCLTVQLPDSHINRSGEPQPVTWKSLVRQTIACNTDLQNARFAIQASARSRDIAFGDYLPSFTGDFDRGASRTAMSSSSSLGGSVLQDNLGLNLVGSQSFFNGFGTTGNWLQARKNLEAAKLSYDVTSASVRLLLRTAYINVLLQKKLVGVQQEIEKRRKENARLVKLLYKSGQEDLGSSMRADALADQDAYSVRQAAREVESQTYRLAREVGGAFIMPVRMDDDLEKMLPKVSVAEADFAALADKVPQVRRFVKQAEAAKAAIISAQSSVWPQVNGNLDYGYSGRESSDLRAGHALGITAAVPFFNGGKNVGAILLAKANYNAAWAAAVSGRDEQLAQLAEAWAQYVDAIESIDYLKKLLEASRKRAEIIKEEYETGLMTFEDFDLAEQNYADSERSYVQGLAAVFTQQANWEALQGLTLEDAINEK